MRAKYKATYPNLLPLNGYLFKVWVDWDNVNHIEVMIAPPAAMPENLKGCKRGAMYREIGITPNDSDVVRMIKEYRGE